jgi:hypothetical protein
MEGIRAYSRTAAFTLPYEALSKSPLANTISNGFNLRFNQRL